jgi:tetratricopeptide (TPR) repeat protein
MAGVAVAVLIAYLPVLDNDFVSWDDRRMLVDNSSYRGFSADHLGWMFTTLHMGHYQPLTWLSLAISHGIGGLSAAHYHAGNVLLHAANAVLVLLLIGALLRRAGVVTDDGDEPWFDLACAGGALLFALHPLRVESVAWATERREVLSGLFFLLSVLAYLRAAEGEELRRRCYAASLVCFVLSLLAEAWAITLPVVLVILDVYPLRRIAPARMLDRDGRRRLLEKVPYAAIGAIFAGLAVWAQSRWAMDVVRDHSFVDRIAQAVYGLGFYLAKTAWPVGLHPAYLLESDFGVGNPGVLVSGICLALIVAWAILRRATRPWALTSLLVYVVVLSPVLGFAQSGRQLVADRYTYLALLPLPVIAAGGIYRILAVRRPWARAAVLVAMLILSLGLGGLTWRQVGVWRSDDTLWRQVLRHDPNNFVARGKRGLARQRTGDWQGALDDYAVAIDANPTYMAVYINRGSLRWQLGDLAGAEEDYRTAVELDPGSAINHLLLGDLLAADGRPREAAASMSRAIELDPDFGPAYTSRGLARRQLGDLDGALRDLTTAIELAPDDPGVLANRGSLYVELENFGAATADLERALRLAASDWEHRAEVSRLLAAVRSAQVRPGD